MRLAQKRELDQKIRQVIQNSMTKENAMEGRYSQNLT